MFVVKGRDFKDLRFSNKNYFLDKDKLDRNLFVINFSKGDYGSRSFFYFFSRRSRGFDDLMKLDIKREERDFELRRMEFRREEIREMSLKMFYYREDLFSVRKMEDRRLDYREYRVELGLFFVLRFSLFLFRVFLVESMGIFSLYRYG